MEGREVSCHRSGGKLVNALPGEAFHQIGKSQLPSLSLESEQLRTAAAEKRCSVWDIRTKRLKAARSKVLGPSLLWHEKRKT